MDISLRQTLPDAHRISCDIPLFMFVWLLFNTFCPLKSRPLRYMCFLGQAVFTYGNSKFQIHSCVPTKHKHTSSAGLHKLIVRSTRLLVTPDTSDTANPSTGWQRADAILREILIFFLICLSTEWDLGVSHELHPSEASGDSFTLCYWASIYTLVYWYELNGYHNLKMKTTCTVTSQNSQIFALWCDITHLDNGKAQEEKSSL